MEKDYSEHRLKNDASLKPYYTHTFKNRSGVMTFWQYAERLYRKITMMLPGEVYKIDDLVNEENRDVFIKLLCAFIVSGIAQDFYFNDTFTEFRRVPELLTQSKENILRNK